MLEIKKIMILFHRLANHKTCLSLQIKSLISLRNVVLRDCDLYLWSDTLFSDLCSCQLNLMRLLAHRGHTALRGLKFCSRGEELSLLVILVGTGQWWEADFRSSGCFSLHSSFSSGSYKGQEWLELLLPSVVHCAYFIWSSQTQTCVQL